MDFKRYLKEYPNKEGRFGKFGGAYLPEKLVPAFEEINEAYLTICHSSQFINELRRIRREFQGRPTPVYHCERLSRKIGNCQIYLKREDLNHSGAHKLNHCMGEGLLAKFMGKKRIIAETGAGQHGVALATAAAFFGLDCTIYMGEVDIKKQAPNVARMKVLGAKVVPVARGAKTLKEAVDAAFEDYLANYKETIYCIGSAVGPHPFPMMVRDFQTVVGIEAREQFKEMMGFLPDVVTACVGGGSNAIGSFYHFIGDKSVRLIGCEAAGRGIHTMETAATVNVGSLGIFHGMKSYFCQDKYGQIAPVYSISAGLDYPGVGPEHAYLHDLHRAEYVPVTDDEAVDAFEYLARTEGIIPAIESAHAVAYARKLAPTMDRDKVIVVTLSGRGDKDVAAIARYRGEDLHE